MTERDEDHGGGDRQVDQEDQSPRHGGDEEPANERAQGGGDTPKPGPCADDTPALQRGERCLEDGEATGGEQGAPDTLQHPCRDEQSDVGCDRADQRCAGEPRHADDEDLPSPEAVTERAGEKDEAGDGEEVPSGHPLQAGNLRMELLADRRLRNADNGGVQLRHRTAEDRRGEHPLPAGGGEMEPAAILRSAHSR